MLPTMRLLGLGFGLAVLLGIGSLQPLALDLAVLYFIGVVALAALDVRLGPAASAFTVERRHEPRLSLGEQNGIDLRVFWRDPGSHAVRGLRIWARDETPPEIPVDCRILTGTIEPRGEWTGRYHLKPSRRGDFKFGAAHLRVEMPLRLIVRQYRYAIGAVAHVYPNLRALHRYELLTRRGSLPDTGSRHLRRLGMGTEFERLREYQPDDDFRRIAWKATARRHQPMTIDYEAERSQNLMIVLDTGRLMGTPVGPMQKLDYAVNAALMLAYVSAKVQDQVGLLTFADRVELYIPPRRGGKHFQLLLDSLYKVQSQQVEPDPGRALAFLANRQARRSLVVLFTDLPEATEAELLVRQLGVLAHHHLPLYVAVGDPGLIGLASALPSDSRQTYQKVVAQRLLDERRTNLQRLEQLGALAVDVPPERLTAEAIDQYLEVKARGRL